MLAAAFEKDKNHVKAREALRSLKSSRLIAAPVEVELFFMISTRLSHQRAVQILQLLQSPAFQIIDLTQLDRQRMLTIMQQYQDAELDFADVAQISIAERLGFSTIYTFDRRDFSIIIPKHIPSFVLLP